MFIMINIIIMIMIIITIMIIIIMIIIIIILIIFVELKYSTLISTKKTSKEVIIAGNGAEQIE